jgi:hypothetical protein
LVSGVTASRALIEAAIAANADAILVHHGLFWRGQDGRVTGWMRERLRLLLAHGIHLLPTTCRWMRTPNWATTPSWVVCWACRPVAGFGEQDLGFCGRAIGALVGAQHLADHVAGVLGRPVTCVGGADRRFDVWLGARVALKAILRRRLPKAWTHS